MWNDKMKQRWTKRKDFRSMNQKIRSIDIERAFLSRENDRKEELGRGIIRNSKPTHTFNVDDICFRETIPTDWLRSDKNIKEPVIGKDGRLDFELPPETMGMVFHVPKIVAQHMEIVQIEQPCRESRLFYGDRITLYAVLHCVNPKFRTNTLTIHQWMDYAEPFTEQYFNPEEFR